MPSYPSRRTVLTASLAGTAALLATGCSGGEPARPAAAPTAEARLRRAAARESATLLDRYDATSAAHPALAAALAPLREAVAQHMRAFGGTPAPAPGTDAGPDAAESSDADDSPDTPESPDKPNAPVRVPEDAGAALRALADAERAAADRRTAALLDAAPETARLLASVAAAGASHGYLLTELLPEVA
ncbi:hypothetical protein [Streptomyces alkaliterrae]|uniref:hypothetical protein n=1 Tax=Streptomyces alkaliterrae TaxID=2213162 RepID=UPI002B1EB757|nr:hypothetical protein [Streptomyces alkaliterrae]